MAQSKIKEFDFISPIIDKKVNYSKLYKEVLGCSLTKKITEYKNRNFTADKTYKLLLLNFELANIQSIDINNKLKISVYARYAEQKTYESRK